MADFKNSRLGSPPVKGSSDSEPPLVLSSLDRKGNNESLTIVLKLGTSSIMNLENNCPFLSNLSRLVELVVSLRKQGHKVVLVSSGAVGVGLKRLSATSRPKQLSQVQAVAAVGQGRLIGLWDDLFAQFDTPIAQILITKNDISHRNQYLNACQTMRELLSTYNVVPIINENDTISSAEIRFGDNDSLSALIAGMINADWLFLLTDVDALYTDNPRVNPDAKTIPVVNDISAVLSQVSVRGRGSDLGTGGMQTKLVAAELATGAGCRCVILASTESQHIPAVLAGDRSKGTVFEAQPCPMDDRRWWIRHGLKVAGTIRIDAGAVQAIQNHYSLLPSGIVSIQLPSSSSGKSPFFQANQCVSLVDHETGREIARGLSNFNSMEIERLKGAHSSAINDLLGYNETDCIIHRDNIVILQ